jgi:malonate transporter
VTYLQLLLPDFSLILCGFLLCRYTALNDGVWKSVESLVYFFLFPVLLLQNILKTPLDLGATSSLVAAAVGMGLVGIALAYLLPRMPGLRGLDAREHAASAQIAFRFNGLIGLALVDRLSGAPGVLLMSVIIGFCVPLFNVAAVWPMARTNEHHLGAALLKNPLIIATVSGLLLNLAGFHLPDWAAPSVQRVGTAAIPLGLMATGAGLKMGAMRKNQMLSVYLLGTKHVVLPLSAWALAWAMGLSNLQTTVLLAFSALPTSSSAYVLASRMGFDGAYVAGLITLSTLLGVASLTFALGVLLSIQ